MCFFATTYNAYGSMTFKESRAEVFRLMPTYKNPIIFVGDSITEGFPLYSFFRGLNIINYWISWEKSWDVILNTDFIAQKKPRKIFMMLGVNDIIFWPWSEELFQNTKQILSRIKELSPDTKIYVQSILPVSGSFSIFNPEIISYNLLLKDFCKNKKIKFIDLHKDFYANWQLNPKLTYDGLHLTIYWYRLWRIKINHLIK